MLLVLVVIPPPQLTVPRPQAPQVLTLQSTGQKNVLHSSVAVSTPQILPPCIGAVLRQRVAIRIADDPPNFVCALLFHSVCMPCSMCQEARIAKRGTIKTNNACHMVR